MGESSTCCSSNLPFSPAPGHSPSLDHPHPSLDTGTRPPPSLKRHTPPPPIQSLRGSREELLKMQTPSGQFPAESQALAPTPLSASWFLPPPPLLWGLPPAPGSFTPSFLLTRPCRAVLVAQSGPSLPGVVSFYSSLGDQLSLVFLQKVFPDLPTLKQVPVDPPTTSRSHI